MTNLGRIMSGKGRLSLLVCDALMQMIRQGAELGELDQREIVDPITHERRTVKTVPLAWFRRLEKAVEVGAFAKKTVPEIVHRILTTPEAA